LGHASRLVEQEVKVQEKFVVLRAAGLFQSVGQHGEAGGSRWPEGSSLS
jgi:hypothetical protein